MFVINDTPVMSNRVSRVSAAPSTKTVVVSRQASAKPNDVLVFDERGRKL